MSPIVLQALQSYEVMTGGALAFNCYHLGEVSQACRLYESLHASFLNAELPAAALQCQQNILTQLMKPIL